MPNCQLELALSGESLALGMPTRLRVWGRVRSGQCQRVEFTVRPGSGGLILISGQANTDSNGTWSAEFPMLPPIWPCGSHLWVEARCVSGGDCTASGSVEILCKLPPHTWCPTIGRTFTVLLLAALATILAGAAFGPPALVAAGIALVAAAFAMLAFWRFLCAPNWCYVLGAIFWALARATVGGVVLFLATRSITEGLWTISFGALAGMVNIALLRRRCHVPSPRTPLNQLPMW